MSRSRLLRAGTVAVLTLLLGSGAARASEITIIQYDLSGTVHFTRPVAFSQPVYSTSAPGPGGVGSSITFRFGPRPGNQVSVQILSFAESYGMTLRGSVVPAFFTGYSRHTLLAPGITGGNLSGYTAFGTGTGVANHYGAVHCLTDPGFCSFVLGFGSLSIPIPRTRLGVPTYFAGEPTSYGLGGMSWVFGSNFSTVRANRGFRTARRYGVMQGYANLIGTEIGRTVLPVPEPHPWALVLSGVVCATALAFGSARRLS